MIKFQAKHSDVRRERWTDPHRIFAATTRGLTSTTAVHWHLEVKNEEYDIGLIKNYCMTVSMQNTSSIHKLIKQILGSH